MTAENAVKALLKLTSEYGMYEIVEYIAKPEIEAIRHKTRELVHGLHIGTIQPSHEHIAAIVEYQNMKRFRNSQKGR
jgi:hypothetical protein